MNIPTIEKLLEDQLKDLYSAENQLTNALPKMAKKASFDGLKQAILSHLEETKVQVGRLNEIAEILSIKLAGKKCKAMEGLIEEGGSRSSRGRGTWADYRLGSNRGSSARGAL